MIIKQGRNYTGPKQKHPARDLLTREAERGVVCLQTTVGRLHEVHANLRCVFVQIYGGRIVIYPNGKYLWEIYLRQKL